MTKQILLLLPNALELYDLEKQEAQHLDFPTTVIHHQEVIDEKLFEKMVGDFLRTAGWHRGVLILGSKLVYEKSVAKDQPELIEEWRLKVPFASHKVVSINLEEEGEVNVLATNREFFGGVVRAAQSIGAKIDQVVPEQVLGEIGQTLSPEQGQRILENSELLENANFLASGFEELVLTEEVTVPAKSHLRKWVAYGVVVGLLVVLASVVGWLKWQEWSVNPPQLQVIATPAPMVTAEPVASAAASINPDLRIRVLNGSGVSGQASQVKELLTDLGYTEVVTGNAVNSIVIETKIGYRSSVSISDIEAITASIVPEFVEVSSAVATPSGQFDVVVTTGKAK